MSLTKHKTNYAIYTVWRGREDGPHCLVEDCQTLDEVYSLAHQYKSPYQIVLIVDMAGNIIQRYESTTKNK